MKKLRKSRSDKYIFGVCGGLGEYLSIDSTIIRLIWFILALTSFGTFALAYLICGLVIPEDDGYIHEDEVNGVERKDNSRTVIGIGLILVGAVLLGNMVFPWFSYTMRQVMRLWPALLIVLGLYVLLKRD
ncbi:MAG TPA: PspC domain-containing protein [Tissierellaceae bacterium]|nr:PspC domain-containing protein [Tissierellaceae bacterium]